MPLIFSADSSYLKRLRLKFQRKEFVFLGAMVGVFLIYVLLLRFNFFTSVSVTLVTIAGSFAALKLLSILADREYFGFKKADRGIKGEDIIAQELLSLPASYTVYRNIKLRESCDIDCVVIGPNGIFTIEVKSHSGRVGYDGRELTLNNLPFKEKDVLRQAKQEALDVHDYLLKQVNRDIFVTPIIVFSSDGVVIHFGMKQINHVYVVQKKWLIDCITKFGGTIQEVEVVNGAIQTLMDRETSEVLE